MMDLYFIALVYALTGVAIGAYLAREHWIDNKLSLTKRHVFFAVVCALFVAVIWPYALYEAFVYPDKYS